jgi:outer membrane protein assembly factor BamB
VNQSTHKKSNLAVNTPAITEDAVYVAFGNADIARYSHDGKLAWVTRYIPTFGDPKMAWGYGLSPLVLEDSVLFPWDHHTGPCYLIGLDKTSGEIAWKTDRPIGTAHATPLLVEHHGQTDILVPGKNRLTAFDARTHAELWRYGEGEGPFNGEIIVSPVYGDGMVFLQLWRQSPIHAIRLSGGGKPPIPVWISQKPGPQEPSLLYYRGLLYALMDNGVLVCLDGKTGKEEYRQRSSGDSSYTYTRIRAPFINKDGFRFTVYRKSIFSGLGKMLGMQDVEVGYPEFDEAFIIKGNDETKLRALFANERIRQLIEMQPHIYLTVKDDEGWFRSQFPEGVDELYFRASGVIKDLDRLKSLYYLFAETLNHLCHIGSAYEDDPNLSL